MGDKTVVGGRLGIESELNSKYGEDSPTLRPMYTLRGLWLENYAEETKRLVVFLPNGSRRICANTGLNEQGRHSCLDLLRSRPQRSVSQVGPRERGIVKMISPSMWSALNCVTAPVHAVKGILTFLIEPKSMRPGLFHSSQVIGPEDVYLVLKQNLKVAIVQVISPCLNSSSSYVT